MNSGTLPTILVLLCGVASNAAAQWSLGFEWSTNHYGGSAHDTSGAHVTPDGGPGGGAAIGLRLGKAWRRTGIAVRIAFANAGFAISGPELRVTDRTTGRLFEGTALLSTRVGGIGPSGAVRAELGPALLLWDFDGEVRARLGSIGAVGYVWPVAGRFSGAVRLEGMLSKSWFNAGDVPPEFERRVTWRYGVGLGLRYRL